MRLSDTAFVLHARPWRETSLLVEVLGREHGRLGLIARGVQGPKKHVLRAALQPLQLIRLDGDLRGELARLVGAEALDAAPQPAGAVAPTRARHRPPAKTRAEKCPKRPAPQSPPPPSPQARWQRSADQLTTTGFDRNRATVSRSARLQTMGGKSR